MAAAPTSRLVEFLDLTVLAAAVSVAALVGAPALGIAIGSGVWVAQRVAGDLTARRALALGRAKAGLGILAAGLLLRAWMVAFGLLAAGVIDRRAGLVAALLVALAVNARVAVELPRRLRGLKVEAAP